ncbi:hypothetical protein PBY51_002532 [Eleginops maclovinus]|uniref:Uncharacterized protein n=1 Tax=Eleginops maclovinus TaxID=56733 RepID=A0AAN8AFW3_ELEMC|nr:hypothetical protein PBY51_002532 [Eleginops maclovinus]
MRQYGAVTQALIVPGDLRHRYKDSTRPPPCSTPDGATEGCSAVWDHSNKLLPQSGPAEASYTVYWAPIKAASVSCCCWVLGRNKFCLCSPCQRFLSESRLKEEFS